MISFNQLFIGSLFVMLILMSAYLFLAFYIELDNSFKEEYGKHIIDMIKDFIEEGFFDCEN